MSRSTTYYGLTEEAEEFLKENSEFEEYSYTDRWDNVIKSKRPISEKIGECGMFDDYDLFKYKLKDGTWAEEFIQADPWASGPHVFVALKLSDGKEIGLWPESEIENV